MKRTICIWIFVAALAASVAGQTLGQGPIEEQSISIQRVWTIQHLADVRRALPGAGGELWFAPCAEDNPETVAAVPGILWIDPGENPTTERIDWRHFIMGYNEGGKTRTGATVPAGMPILLKNITLRKVATRQEFCPELYPKLNKVQSGTSNIRLWWPLLLEAPGTQYQLNITWGTKQALWFPGEKPRTYSYVHQDYWEWTIAPELEDLVSAVIVFHTVPFGADEVPWITDEELYAELMDYLDSAIVYRDAGLIPEARDEVVNFLNALADRGLTESPEDPDPTGPDQGVADTDEIPAICVLMNDAEYILDHELPTH